MKERYKEMEKFTILFANKTLVFQGLERAKEIAQKQSLVSFRVSVFDSNNKRVARYEWGKEI